MLLNKIAFRLRAVTDNRYRQFYLQRRVTDIPARERKADAVAARLPAFDGDAGGEVAEKARILDREGYVALDGLIRADWLPAMVHYFKENECSDPYRPEKGSFRGPDNVPEGSHVAYFSNEIVMRAPHVFEITNNPGVFEIVSRVLGAKPTLSYMAAWWSVPSLGKPKQAENFHRDVDDWRFIKLFCYLTDVDEVSGPHVYVKGSHKVNSLTEIRRFTDEEIDRTFGAGNQMRFTGPAGTAFLENTYGVHRGYPPTHKPRLLFQAQYSLRPVIYGPKSPVATIGRDGVPAGIDPFVNRVYCRS